MAMTLTGCQTPPTPAEMGQQVDDAESRIRRMVKELQDACPDAACRERWQVFLVDRLTALEEVYNQGLLRDWEAARKSREEWENTVRKLIPGWPELKDLAPLLRNTPISLDLETTTIGSPNAPATTWISTLTVTGTAGTVVVENLTQQATVSGTLHVKFSSQPDNNVSGDVFSGVINAAASTGDTFSLTVVEDERNRIQLNQSGRGTITLVVQRFMSDVAWNAILPTYMTISIPVVRDALGRLNADLSNVALGTLLPWTPVSITDYDANGIRDFSTDYAAFVADHSNGVRRTDIVGDETYDQQDIDLWVGWFNQDVWPGQ